MINRPLGPNNNKLYFFGFTLLLFAVLTYNLFSLQIVKGSSYYFSSKNSFSIFSTVRASRGLIYDRNGVKLVDNELKYNIYVLRDETKENFNTLLQTSLTNLGQVFKEDVQTKYNKEVEKFKNFKNISEIKLYSRIEYNPFVFQLEANPHNFPLVKIEKTNVRKHLYPELFSHIIGYTGEINEEDYKTGEYNFGDEIGKFGIEKGYDKLLRGKNGVERIDVYESEKKKAVSTVTDKINGNDIYLTIDINEQRKLYDLTKKAFEREDMKDTTSSASVLQDTKTGEILAMVSYPTFDSNLFVNNISNQDYSKYINDPGKPLSNKAIQYSQPSGSILKTLTDAVALDKGAITKDTTFTTGGTFDYGGVTFQDVEKRNFGTVNIVQGLCVSSNIFHMKTILELDRVTGGKGADTMADSFSKIGLDKLSGLNIGTEATGYFPVPKDKVAKGQIWLPGYLLNASIGQGDVRLTPLGASELAAAVANRGTVNTPKIIKDNNPPEQRKLDINSKHFDTVKEGMQCAAKRDSGITQYDANKYVEIGEKTGTAQTGQMKNGKEIIHGWEISFAPFNDPKVALAIFLENGQHGYKSGYISREFYKSWSEEQKLNKN